MSRKANTTRVGPGWNLLTVTTETGVPLAWRLTRINEAERTEGTRFAEQELKAALAKLDSFSAPGQPGEIRVLTADSGFSTGHLRHALRDLGVLENIHHVSHAHSDRSQNNAAAKRKKRYAILRDPGLFYDNWYADGHRQLHCRCGHGVVAKRITRGIRGRVSSRLEGQCKSCGPISIDAGRWALRRNNSKRATKEQRVYLAKHEGNVPRDKVEYLFGNPLTFDDAVAGEYGRGRWSYNEGFYGQLVSRFNLLKGKRWIRFADQVKLETSMTFAVMHAVTLEQRARLQGSTWARPPAQSRGQAPPALAVAA
jgi:hypothetical protein